MRGKWTRAWTLSAEDAERFVLAIDEAPEPNAALREAAERYRGALERQKLGNCFPLPIISDCDDEEAVRAALSLAHPQPKGEEL